MGFQSGGVEVGLSCVTTGAVMSDELDVGPSREMVGAVIEAATTGVVILSKSPDEADSCCFKVGSI